MRELFHEVRGTVSQLQRSTADALRRSEPPRPPEVGKAIGRLHAPWWGFAAYAVIYAMTVMAVVAVLASAALEDALRRVVIVDWVWLFWVAMVVTAPLSSWPFRRWVRRRRHDLVTVACDGDLVNGEIAAATVVNVHGGLSLRGVAHSTHLTIECDAGTFRGYVAGQPAWATPTQAVEVVALPTARYALLLLPDGGSRPLKRKRG